MKAERLKYFYSLLLTLFGMSFYKTLSVNFRLIPFILEYPIVYIISAFWGFKAALLSIVIWTICISYYHFNPINSIKVHDLTEMVHLLTFFGASVLVSFLVDQKRQKEIKQSKEIALKAAQEEMIKAKASKLEYESQLKEQFVNTLSHDLRNPLSLALMSAEMMVKNPGDKDKVSRLANKNLISLKRIDMMVQDLLDSRRISAGNELNLNYEKFKLCDLLREIKSDFEYLYGDRFRISLDETVDVTWSKGHMRRAIENLVGNAVKYGSSNTPVEIGFTLQDNKKVDLWVKNQGPTLSSIELDSLFKPFSRLESNVQKKEGWGIGLSVVKAIVSGHKGSVYVTCKEEEGTIFHLVIPAHLLADTEVDVAQTP